MGTLPTATVMLDGASMKCPRRDPLSPACPPPTPPAKIATGITSHGVQGAERHAARGTRGGADNAAGVFGCLELGENGRVGLLRVGGGDHSRDAAVLEHAQRGVCVCVCPTVVECPSRCPV